MKKYFLHNGTEQDGPFNLSELKEKNLKKNTPIWYEGITDWVDAEKIEELKDYFKTETPPPFKKEQKQTPPPIKNKVPQKKVTKKKISGKKILLTIVIGSVIAFGGLFIYANIQANNSSSYDSYSSKAVEYEETKMTIAEIEESQPTKFLDASGTYRENFLGDKLKVNGTITNSATVATYKDAIVRVTYYSKTKTNLGTEDYTIWDYFPSKSYKTISIKNEELQKCKINRVGCNKG